VLCAQGAQQLPGVETGTPLAVCKDCSGLVCEGHAERAQAAGKWFCLRCIAEAVGAEEGRLPESIAGRELRVAVRNFSDEFPRVVEAVGGKTEAMRRFRIADLGGT
jgi:hypothetical protein